MTSADRRFAAASNEIRVLVESSKKRLTIVRPLKVGNFLTGVSVTRASSAAVSRRLTASSLLKSAIERRCLFMRDLRCSPGRDRLSQKGKLVLAHFDL